MVCGVVLLTVVPVRRGILCAVRLQNDAIVINVTLVVKMMRQMDAPWCQAYGIKDVNSFNQQIFALKCLKPRTVTDMKVHVMCAKALGVIVQKKKKDCQAGVVEVSGAAMRALYAACRQNEPATKIHWPAVLDKTTIDGLETINMPAASLAKLPPSELLFPPRPRPHHGRGSEGAGAVVGGV